MAQMTRKQRKILRQVWRLMQDEHPVMVMADVRSFFLILNCIQFAWRLDSLEPSMQRKIKELGDFVAQCVLTVHPGVELTINAGWDREMDVPREQETGLDEELRRFLTADDDDSSDLSE